MNNDKKLIILGAGGHGHVVAETAEFLGYDVKFLDDSKTKDFDVIGKISDYKNYINDYSFFVAIGNNSLRRKLFSELDGNETKIVSLVHPNAFVSPKSKIGNGTIVMPGAVINIGVTIGDGCIINTCSSVDHDCSIADFAHISVGAHLAGNVKIGRETFVGAGATVINNVHICPECMIGAGATVVKDIVESGTYIGVPAVKK